MEGGMRGANGDVQSVARLKGLQISAGGADMEPIT
jgi:hypothetical protein